MSSNYNKKKKASLPASTMLLIVLVVTLLLIFAAVLIYYAVAQGKISLKFGSGEPAVSAATEMTEPTQESGPDGQNAPDAPKVALGVVVTASGDSASVTCKQGYTVEAPSAADKAVAKIGKAELTNAALQVWYLSEVNAYRESGADVAPDFSQPLDLQRCPLGDGSLSWQHYFLEKAVNSWCAQQAMLNAAAQPQIIHEAAYKPNETDDLHGKYIAEDLPVNGFLYADKDHYTPNEMHQAYLDGLEEQLETLAKKRGYADLADYVSKVYGSSVQASDVVDAAKELNTSYMYFTERSYYVEVTDDEVEDYLSAHRSELSFEPGTTVDISHMLIIPEGAEVADDGTVTADEEDWKKCRTQLDQSLQSWEWDYQTSVDRQASFARMANQKSADEGSRLNGGYYRNVVKGELMDELDAWCFDPDRKAGDTEILFTKLGYHVMYMCGVYDNGFIAARDALVREKQQEEWKTYIKDMKKTTVDYSAVELWADAKAEPISLVDVLYPDIAHERFPLAITYLQQDYMYHPYGGSYVGRGGCGITTMAMLSTYMTDRIYTPAMLASKYPQYHDASGTNGDIFRYVPAELGFYMDRMTSNIDDAVEALKNDQRVISLQIKGNFTSGGHYLLLQHYYEDTDTFQVRDSNIYNYARLKGHKVDYFTRADILSGNSNMYIMQLKIRRIPACVRCGLDMEQKAPELLLKQDYICEKCVAALSRRNHFLEIPEKLFA